MLSRQKKLLYFLLYLSIIFTFIPISFSATSTCTEQWSEIGLPIENWTKVGGDSVIISSTDSGPSFIFDGTSSDMVGAVWNDYDFSKKKGLLISFNPEILCDESYTGNLRYPQGFAVVFTSSSLNNLIGEKGSGLGYDGIINAVVFEFDFVKQLDKNDHRKSHFSVHYNINGPVSSSSINYDNKELYNKVLPNFYDKSKFDHHNGIIFEIQLIGNRIIVKTNVKGVLVDTTFSAFQKLLEQDEVHVGITASMNRNKKVTINNFKVSEISTKEKGSLTLKSSETTFKAGEDITLLYSIESTCGEKLKIYSDEYLSNDDFRLKINDQNETYNSISFNDEKVQLEMIVSKKKADIYTAIVEFKQQVSSPITFTVSPSDVQRLEICEIEQGKIQIQSDLKRDKDNFYVPICLYDQFDNPKEILSDLNKIKVLYPHNLVQSSIFSSEISDSPKKRNLKVPISIFGDYSIFSEDFKNEKIRNYTFLPKQISPEKSKVSILYGKNIITSADSNVSLRIQPKDNYGRDIPAVILDRLGCEYSDSKIEEDNNMKITSSYEADYILLTVNKPSNYGKYTFVPKISCPDHIKLTTFKCGVDSTTKLNNCQFYYLSKTIKINTASIKMYSDFLDSYNDYSSSGNQVPLIISLDEKEDKKLTEVLLLDDTGSIYFSKYTKSIVAKLEGTKLEVVKIGYKIFLLLPIDKSRENYSPVRNYNLDFIFESKTFTIPVKFYFLNQIKCNIDIATTTPKVSYIAFYKQSSLTLKASDKLLLFDIYEMNDNKYLGEGKTLDIKNVILKINGKETRNNNITKYGPFISVSNNDLTKAGSYNIELIYNNTIAKIDIEIISKEEAFSLGYENGKQITANTIYVNREKLYKFTLLDKFGNPLMNNQVFKAFSKIKIKNSESFTVRPNYDGKIHIINNGKDATITFLFNSGNEYNIMNKNSITFADVDPLNSYGVLYENHSPVYNSSKITVNVILKDKYGISINDKINGESINVYAEGDNVKIIIHFKASDINPISGGVKYTGDIFKSGDYSIKIFINNFPVECKGCNIRVNYNYNLADNEKTMFYIISNKKSIPLAISYKKSYNKTNNNENVIKAALINKNKTFLFYYEQNNKYDIEVKPTKSTSFDLSRVDKSLDKTVSVDPEKEYYTINNENYNSLQEGLYHIHKRSEESTGFYIYLTDSEFDNNQTTPNIDKSMVILKGKEIYGKTDVPGSLIIDFRTDNYKRIIGLDLTKITITNNNLKFKAVEGPEKGLVTLLLIADKPGEYDFNVKYDNKELLSENYKYICDCGFEKKLKYIETKTLDNGNYLFFNLTDLNENECYSSYNWKDLNQKYADYILSITGSNIQYKTKTYYNHISNNFIVYLDRHVNGDITISSNLDIFTIKLNGKLNLKNNILDENHFYVEKQDKQLVIKTLDDNYKIFTTSQNLKDNFAVALIRIINDDIVTIENKFTITNDLTVNIETSNKKMDANGNYWYIIYYKGKEVFCKNCKIKKSSDSLGKIKIYHKEGTNNYIEDNKGMNITLYKSNFPFFKINLISTYNNLIKVSSGVTIQLKAQSQTLGSNIKYASNGNIYVYLTKEGRKTYLSLNAMDKLTLKVSHSSKSHEISYYVMNHYVEEPNSLENCASGAIPVIVDRDSFYIKRVDEQLELEVYLSGCGEEEKQIYTQLKIMEERTSKAINVDVIPTDLYGGYLLFLPNTLELTNATNYYIINKDSKSEKFELNILPGYEVNSISFEEDKNIKEITSNKLYTYFYVHFKDAKNNIITGVGRNLFANDLPELTVQNEESNQLPYKLTYDNNKQAFRCQVPITGKGSITINTTSNQYTVNVSDSPFHTNSLVSLTEENNVFKFTISLKDEFYKSSDSTDYQSSVSFTYVTLNPVNEEIFIRKVSATKTSNHNFQITLESSYPKYAIYGFIPYIGGLPQICISCFKKDKFPGFIYSISNEMYMPHVLERQHYLIKNYDLPTYLYLSYEEIKFTSSEMDAIQISSTSMKTKLYLLSKKADSDNINIQFKSGSASKQLNITLKDYSETTAFNETEFTYSEIYGLKTYNKNYLDTIDIFFFMELRGKDNKLVSTTPEKLIFSSFKDKIKNCNVIDSNFYGIFLVKITLSKASDFEYVLQFNEYMTNKNSSTIQINLIPAFPNQIIINNRERIDSRTLRFELTATNVNSEKICDERLNLYFDDSYIKSIKKKLLTLDNKCYLYAQFYGETEIKSNVLDFPAEISNNIYSLDNINPQYSSLSTTTNVFTKDSKSFEITFNEKSPSLTKYSEDEIIGKKELYAFIYVSPLKIKFTKAFGALYANQYQFNIDNTNFTEGNTYILIGSILDNCIHPLFVRYNKANKLSSEKKIQAKYYSTDKKSYSLTNLKTSTSNDIKGDSFELNIPLFLRIYFLDSNEEIINIGKNDNINLKADLILFKNNKEEQIQLISRQYDDNYFEIKLNPDNISQIKNLPTTFTGTSYGYYIKLSYSSTNYYSLLSLKENSLQIPNIKDYNYGFSTEQAISTFSIKTVQDSTSTDLYILKNVPQHICFFVDNAIPNVHINKDNLFLKIGTTNISSVVNSYRGCIMFSHESNTTGSSLSIKYNSKDASNTMNLYVYEDSEMSFSFDESKNDKNFGEEDFYNLNFNSNYTLLIDYFSVYINGEKALNQDLNLKFDKNIIKLTIPRKYFSTINRNKKIMVVYNGMNNQKYITNKEFSINRQAILYDFTNTKTNYEVKIQDPLNLKAGDKIKFYLIIRDTEYKACYYGDFSKLSNIKIKTNLDSKDIEKSITEITSLDGYYQCEKTYVVDLGLSSSKSKDLDISVNYFKDKEETFKLHISPKEIDPIHSKFSGTSFLNASQTVNLAFEGTDSYENKINYFDFLESFNIKIINSTDGQEVNNTDYSFNKTVASDNSKINILFKIKRNGDFEIKALNKGTEMKLQTPFKITVDTGECSINAPDPKLLSIDKRDKYYIGEEITAQIECKDKSGNVVKREGNSLFIAKIKKVNSTMKYTYTKSFENGKHIFKFSPPSIGDYTIDFTLNGKTYGDTQNFTILGIDSSKYNCMDKSQVDHLGDCINNNYKNLVEEILGDKYICKGATSANPNLFKCLESDKTCVNHTKFCNCTNKKWNGFCYSKDSDPLEEIKIANEILIEKNGISRKAYACKDGSYRFKESECNTTFECPLGFKVCGVKCILLNQVCEEKINCNDDEVKCWDLSCAKKYDLCPTRISCPKNKVLCPDGSCQETGHCIQPIIRTCPNSKYQCPDFSCVSSRDDCPKNKICEFGLSLCENGECLETCEDVIVINKTNGTGQIRCPNGTFVENLKLCPTEMYVPKNYVKCPKGGIAINLESCEYVQEKIPIVCNKSKPILCPDFECVEKGEDCEKKNTPTCPPHKPYQCWNNECRTSKEECPTKITCNPSTPVLCQNGFCAKSSEECMNSEKDKCPNYRCFDGTCVPSMELCPTHSYCGKDIIKCWNGACANSTKNCRSSELEECPTNLPYRCPDGSCRKTSNDCSSMTTCPPNLPIKCFDNSCRASIDECPVYHSCGDKVSCPDGTCASSYDQCNTVVTCLSGKPYLCYDNTCKYQLEDCPEPPKCQKNEVLCPNGNCVSNRQNCKIFDPCDSVSPTKCESNVCTDNFNQCNEITKRCPIGYILCNNGECKTSEYLCDNFECPKNKPYLCKEGICVEYESLCDDPNSGCPYNRNYKCPNGTCVISKDECCHAGQGFVLCNDDSCADKLENCPSSPGYVCKKDKEKDKEKDIICPNGCPYEYSFKCPDGTCVVSKNQCKDYECGEGKVICADGSCVDNIEKCPLKNGCYKDRPFKCADGTCINPDTSNCSLVLCPFNNPYKCPNGYCAKKSSECPYDLNENDKNDCKDGFIMCVDGRCVKSVDYCRPFYECETGYYKCKDGTCRVSPELCPELISCPPSRPYSCSSNKMCVKNEDECSTGLICPNGLTKCTTDGSCVKNSIDCPSSPNIEITGCSNNKKKCPNGRCVDSIDKCSLISNACPDDTYPYLWKNGECKEEIPPSNDNITECANGTVQCPEVESPPSKRCVENTTEAFRTQCSNNIGCPLNKPYRCANGECVKSEKNCGIIIACDISRPYYCKDGSCVSDPSFCKSFVGKRDNLTLCENGYFVPETGGNCAEFKDLCPLPNPILCPSGSCTDDIKKCSTSFNKPSCEQGHFYCARFNKCMNKKIDCLKFYEDEIGMMKTEKNETNATRMLSENFVNPLSDSNFIKKYDKSDNDFISLKEENIKICYDGTIVTGEEKCPIVPACKMGEYRCRNGGCASDIDKCNNTDDYECKDNYIKCPDGICRENCNDVEFQGCEVGKYQCTNGLCVDDKYDCIGHSMCSELEFPFRCMNGECKRNPEDCEIIERLGSVKDIQYSFNKYNKIQFNFAYNSNGRVAGKIEIPGNGLQLGKDYSNLYIEEIPSSLINNKKLYNNSAEFLFDIANSISGSEGVLNYENSVMSPVFKLYNKESATFKINGIISLVHNEYETSGLYYYDYCLAKLKGFNLNDNTINYNGEKEDYGWECVERQTSPGQTEFPIKEFGVYAIILNPSRQAVNYFGDTKAKNFFLENIKVILIVFAIIICVFGIVFYIFMRVTRYRQKYHENRTRIQLLKQQKEEYENMTTDIFGQTLGDNINGIVYKSNPAYKVTSDIKKSGSSLEEEIEKLQIECRNVNEQNERLKKDIENITGKYQSLSANIEKMHK